MLKKTVLAASHLYSIEDVRCKHEPGSGWSGEEVCVSDALVFVRRGSFRRRFNGADLVADTSAVYFESQGREQQIAHPYGEIDACTQVILSEPLLAAVGGDSGLLPQTAIPTSPQVDLRHRVLVAAARRGAGPDVLDETVIDLVGNLIRREHAARQDLRLRRAVRRLVEDAKAAISADPSLSLIQVAAELSVSPYHLSRSFKRVTGQTLCRFRRTVRVRLALDRLDESRTTLAQIAADSGFADHAHLTRSFRVELDQAPSSVRRLLR